MLPLLAKYNDYSVNHNPAFYTESQNKTKSNQKEFGSQQNKGSTSWNSLLHFREAGEIQNSSRLKQNQKICAGINTDSHHEKYFSLEVVGKKMLNQ